MGLDNDLYVETNGSQDSCFGCIRRLHVSDPVRIFGTAVEIPA